MLASALQYHTSGNFGCHFYNGTATLRMLTETCVVLWIALRKFHNATYENHAQLETISEYISGLTRQNVGISALVRCTMVVAFTVPLVGLKKVYPVRANNLLGIAPTCCAVTLWVTQVQVLHLDFFLFFFIPSPPLSHFASCQWILLNKG